VHAKHIELLYDDEEGGEDEGEPAHGAASQKGAH
jgi:hypothetical protein